MSKNECNDIWHCSSCNEIHLLAGGVRLDFDRDEFDAFAQKVVEFYCTSWLPHPVLRTPGNKRELSLDPQEAHTQWTH
ncbi:MAG TPA: hypothetical protein PKD26_00370 [Pyrinomonadaceae bacterium]|mgnify:CR=1 FL=1|nr:hypothetical protein [Pyrinomonadaceae bacterium]